jgi:hypothetical protein
MNRIGSSKLYQLTRILDVPVSFFFDDMSEATASEGSSAPTKVNGGAVVEKDPMLKRETLELVRAYYRITDPTARKRLFDLAKSIASLSAEVAAP